MDQFTSPQIGLALRRLRKKHNLTQKDLANGICSQAEISKIESGTHSPTVDLLFALSRRLQVPITVFLNQNQYIDSIGITDERLLILFQNQEYELIYKEAKEIIKSLKNDEELTSLYSYYFQICAYRMNKIDFRTCIVELQLLTDKYTKLYYSPKMVLRLKSAIATLYYEKKHYLHGLKVYEELIDLNFESEEFIVEKIRILYNTSKVLLDLKRPSDALKYIENGIVECLRFKDMSLLGQLYYQKAYTLELLKSSASDISDSYKKAYLLFDILKMNEYKQILLDKKKSFLI
ncbi:helix-turn-helix domain-containing protein [Exiguobacterium oxidotolerans]|uniref:helix-turn-helix domain-containing protein n=1 Tax=Exiguobacterium oxidotolerans TaxID=223958 RepID=UPI000494477C|nr:helix-turn-helix domain-containing protein [Exiguobacterium oxidotolerans]